MKKLKKITAAVLSCVMAFSSLSFGADAASYKYYIRSLYSDVNVRSGPGTKYDIVGKVKAGSKFDCISSAVDQCGNTWYRIKCNIDVAWISGDYTRRYQNKIRGDAEPANEDTTGSEVNASIQKYINSAAKKYGANGMQVAVIRGSDGELFTWEYGYATKNTEVMETDTKIRLASITKAFVGMCAAKMQEQGIVDINEDIGIYWGAELPKKVTLKNLMTHTSPLRYLSFKPTAADTLAQLTDENSYLDVKTGSKSAWSYNNYSAGIAGSTLEIASGKTLESFAKKNFFEPLGIEATFHSGTFGEDTSIATLYEADGSVERTVAESRVIKGSKKPGNNTSSFAGGLTASAKDTAKLFSVLAGRGEYNGERFLSPESVELLEEKQFKTTENGGKFYQCVPMRYASNRCGASKLFYHTGNAYGAISLASYNPETGDTVVVLSVGAKAERDKYGVYSVCSTVAKKLYKTMETLGE